MIHRAKCTVRLLATQVKLGRLMEQLYACVTAQQASEVLGTIRKYLLQGANLQMIEAAEALQQVSSVRLPFERLVRNVWTEGPEVAYDRNKATLQKLLEGELQTRATEAKWAASSAGTYGPKPLVPQLVHDARVSAPPPKTPPARKLSPRPTPGALAPARTALKRSDAAGRCALPRAQ